VVNRVLIISQITVHRSPAGSGRRCGQIRFQRYLAETTHGIVTEAIGSARVRWQNPSQSGNTADPTDRQRFRSPV